MAKLTAIQLTSTPSVVDNLAAIEQQLSLLESSTDLSEEHLVVLPECCLFFGGRDAEQLALAEQTYQSDLLRKELAVLAKRYNVHLVAGSIPLYLPAENKFTNSCCVFSADGEQIAQYDKIHLFDVNVDDNEKSYRESRYTQAGHQVVTANVNELTVGLSVCYDLRFPELFRHLASLDAAIITVPSAFTKVTGQAHWQTLLQARAIENQVYIVAAGQQGIHANKRETWGHSMIINPWGEIIACLEEGQGSISADFCQQELAKIRQSIPVAKHNQFTTKLKNI